MNVQLIFMIKEFRKKKNVYPIVQMMNIINMNTKKDAIKNVL